CLSYTKAFPYALLLKLLRDYFELTTHDADDIQREKVLAKIQLLGANPEETAPYVCSLLGIPGPDDAILQQLAPELKRRRIFNAIETVLARESAKRPVVIILEDVHWIDAASEEFLLAFSRHVSEFRVLLLVNYRPEFHDRWTAVDGRAEIALQPLSAA